MNMTNDPKTGTDQIGNVFWQQLFMKFMMVMMEEQKCTQAEINEHCSWMTQSSRWQHCIQKESMLFHLRSLFITSPANTKQELEFRTMQWVRTKEVPHYAMVGLSSGEKFATLSSRELPMIRNMPKCKFLHFVI